MSLREFVDEVNQHGTPNQNPERLQPRELLQQLRVIHLGELVGKTDEYTVQGTFTETRAFDTDTATLADVVDLLATLLLDLKTKGPLE